MSSATSCSDSVMLLFMFCCRCFSMFSRSWLCLLLCFSFRFRFSSSLLCFRFSNFGSSGWLLFTIKKTSGCLFSENIKLEDLTNRHEDWSTVSLSRSWASRSLDVLILHGLLLLKFVLNSLELAEIALVHKHRSKVIIGVPETLLDLLTDNCL